MDKKLFVLILLCFSLSLTFALKPSYETVEFSSDYYPLMEKGITYTEQLNIDTSISRFSNFELTLWGDWKSGVVSVFINGFSCSPNGWTTPTAEGYKIRFDCTNAVNNVSNKKNLILTYRSTKDAENVYGTIKATYLTKGESEIEVHGTEYTYGQIAKVWLQLLNSTGDDVTTGVCYTDIYTPAGGEYIENALMTNMVHDGIYYYDLPVPIGAGVYPVIAKCYYDSTSSNVFASSYSIYEGRYIGGSIASTKVDDGAFLEVRTDNNVRTTYQLDMNFTFSQFYGNCSSVSEDLLSSISITWKGKWETTNINHDIEVYFWNYTSGEYVLLPNIIGGGLGGTLFSVSNSLATNNITKALGVTSTNPLIVRVNDTLNAEGEKKFKTYYLYASCEQLTNPEWQEVKGSSELHVTADHPWQIEITSGEIKNDTFPNFFYYNFTIESGVGIDSDDVYTHINMPTPFNCHHVNKLYIEGVEYNFTKSNADNDPLSKGCKVNWYMDMDVGQNYEATIVADNWFKEIEVTWLTEMELQHDIIGIACENYQEANSLPDYVLPRPNSSNPFLNRTDNFYDVCYAYLDVYYHYNQSYFYEYYTPQGIFTADDMLYLDNLYMHMIEGRDELDLIAQTILNGLTTGGMYSVAVLNDPYPPANPFYTLYWANISTTYLTFAQVFGLTSGAINVSIDTSEITQNVWEYETRNLTYVNGTEIANDVWNETQPKYIYGTIIP